MDAQLEHDEKYANRGNVLPAKLYSNKRYEWREDEVARLRQLIHLYYIFLPRFERNAGKKFMMDVCNSEFLHDRTQSAIAIKMSKMMKEEDITMRNNAIHGRVFVRPFTVRGYISIFLLYKLVLY
jgi:hypothetical protein